MAQENNTAREQTALEKLSQDALNQARRERKMIQDTCIAELAQCDTEIPEALEKQVQAEIASLQQAKENLSSAHKIASSTVDELSARAADVAKSLNRKWYRINPPSNTAIDVQEEEKSFFARGMNGYKIALIVFIGSFAGVMLELLWCFARHGYLESRSGLVWGPFNMLYGLGAASLSIILYRFRNRVKKEINEVFTQTVLLLSSKGFISLNVEYIDGTKIESKANKYTFVWRKTVERNRERLMKKIHILLGQIDNVIAQENSSESNEEIEFTPAMLTEMAGELRQALEQVPEPSTKEEKTALKKKRKQLKELEEHRDKLQEYDCHLETLQERNSYSKTDKDATFMRMKEDAMRNGQTKPGYNLQIGTENQFITDFALFPNPTDTLTLIPFLQSFSNRYDRMAHTVVADSGYGSEENYRFMSENGMEAYVKYNYFHMEQRPRFKPDPFKAENFYYNEEQDFCICPMGQKMQRIGTRHVKTASGYVSENARYRAIRCEGCPLRCRCFKAKGNRTIELNHRLRKYKQKAKELLCSEEGLKHRGQRCIEPEAVFGQMKNNMNYKRFRHFGKDKVFMDFAFFAIAFNIKKMCAKMTKEGMDWLIRPFYELTVVLFRCCERINQRNPQNIAA